MSAITLQPGRSLNSGKGVKSYRLNGALVATTTAGEIYDQHHTGVTMDDYIQSWRPVLSLPKA